MTKDTKPQLPFYLSLMENPAKDYPDNKDKLLPEWFKFGFYEDMALKTSLGFWVEEFHSRIRIKIKTGPLSIDEANIYLASTINEFGWNNGVYSTDTIEGANHYFAEATNLILIQNKGKSTHLDPAQWMDRQKLMDKVNQDYYSLMKWINDNPNKVPPKPKEVYRYINGELRKIEFQTVNDMQNYDNKIHECEHNTANFLVNLNHPTNKLIDQLKKQITELKKKRNISNQKGKSKKFQIWAESLAVWDLYKAGIESDVIQNRVLSKWHDGKPDKLDSIKSDKDLVNMFRQRIDKANEMITTGWKNLSGQINPTP